MSPLVLYILPAVIAFLTSFMVGRLLCTQKLAGYFIDDVGGKKLHQRAVPASGGIALIIGVVLPIVLFDQIIINSAYFYFIMGGIGMFVLGLVDDLKPLGWLLKLLFQIAIITAVVVLGDLRLESVLLEHSFFRLPYALSVLISVVMITFLTNAFNFIDGVDGLATAVALIFILGLLYFQTTFSGVFLMCMAAALFGFRQLNREPAALFMGDSGSLFIGFCCACLGIFFLEADLNINNTQLDSFQQRLPVLLALFWFPIADTIRVLILRLSRKQALFKRDKLHSYSSLLRLGYSHSRIVTLVVILTLLNVFGAWYLEPLLGVLLFLVVQVAFSIVLHFYLNSLIKNFTNLKENSNG